MLNTIRHTTPLLVRQVIALTYTALLTLVLLQSSSQPYIGPAAPPGPPDLGREIFLTTGHIVGFSLLVVVWWWALMPTSGAGRGLILTVIIAITLGIVTETMQSLVPDRSVSLFDLAVNIGVSLAAAWVIKRWG